MLGTKILLFCTARQNNKGYLGKWEPAEMRVYEPKESLGVWTYCFEPKSLFPRFSLEQTLSAVIRAPGVLLQNPITWPARIVTDFFWASFPWFPITLGMSLEALKDLYMTSFSSLFLSALSPHPGFQSHPWLPTAILCVHSHLSDSSTLNASASAQGFPW